MRVHFGSDSGKLLTMKCTSRYLAIRMEYLETTMLMCSHEGLYVAAAHACNINRNEDDTGDVPVQSLRVVCEAKSQPESAFNKKNLKIE